MRRLLFPGLLLSLGLGCASSRIPNTDVPDTSENRDVVAFCERYRRAVESRDARALLAMASPRYFEDGGTPDGSASTASSACSRRGPTRSTRCATRSGTAG